MSYGPKVDGTRKPYAFVGFGGFALSTLLGVVLIPGSRPQIRLCQKQLDCTKTPVTWLVGPTSTN